MTFCDGDARVHAEILDRIERAIADGNLLPDSDEELRSHVSPLLAIFGSSDLNSVEAQTGLPAPLALMLEQAVYTLAQTRRQLAREIVYRWFATPKVGADLSGVPTALAMHYLSTLSGASGLEPEVASGILAIRDLHVAMTENAPPTRAQWSLTRNAMLAQADRLPAGINKQIAELAAELAWPVDRSHVVMREAMIALCHLAAAQAAEAEGLSADVLQAHTAKRQVLWESTAAERERDPSGRYFEELFEKQHPEVSRDYARRIEIEDEAYTARMPELVEDIFRQFSALSEQTATRLPMNDLGRAQPDAANRPST